MMVHLMQMGIFQKLRFQKDAILFWEITEITPKIRDSG